MEKTLATLKEQFIRVSIIDDGEGNTLFKIKLDDEGKLVITTPEMVGLKKILNSIEVGE